MWVRASAQLSDSVFQVTTAVSSHLLIHGQKTALVDASIDSVSEELISSIVSQLGEGVPLDYIFLSHAHFDHVGCLAALRKLYPEVQVLSSSQTARIFSDEAVKEEFYQQNVECSVAMKKEIGFESEQWCAALEVDQIIRDGDSISLDTELVVKVIDCPGHTVDSLSFYIYPDEILCGGEALGGYGGKGRYMWSFASSYSDYITSLDKLSALSIKAIGLPHSGALTGELASKYLLELRDATQGFIDDISQRLQDGEDSLDIADSLCAEWKSGGIAPEGPYAKTVMDSIQVMVALIEGKCSGGE